MSFEVLTFDSLDSTNEEAKRRLNQGGSWDGLVIRAKWQTAGKGTQGRKWISPEGTGLYFSIVHRFQDMQPVPVTPLLTLAAGVACAKAVEELTGLKIQLKPVNDLYWDGRKLGGILVESLMSGEQCRGVITGIGINILRNEDVVLACETEQRGNRPVSLQEAVAPVYFSRWNPEQIIEELMGQIARQVHLSYEAMFQTESTDSLIEEYLRYKIPEIPLPEALEKLTR